MMVNGGNKSQSLIEGNLWKFNDDLVCFYKPKESNNSKKGS